MTALPLVDRPDRAALFIRPEGPVDRARFLADVDGLAARTPPAAHLLNLCRDRYWFAVAFCAAVLRGQVCLLSGDPSPGVIEALVARFPNTVAAVDSAMPALPCPAVTAPGEPGAGHDAMIPADQLAAIVLTSGSTGVPVAHPKRWGALVARSRAAGERFHLAERHPVSIVGTVPPGHMYGFETTTLLPLHAACASWCGHSFFPADVAAALAAVPAPRILVTTPLQLRTLQAIDLHADALTCCISATAPLDPALAATIEARWHTQVLEIFGATECGSIASRRTTDGDFWLPYPGVTLDETDSAVVVRDPTAPPIELADEIERQPDGRFRLLGRRADMVKLGGRRASLAGLNRILTGLDGVRDGIFVVPDDLDQRSTARLLALVVAPDRTIPSLLAELRDRIDPVFLPRRLVRVDALPRNALGKLPRQAVLDLLAALR